MNSSVTFPRPPELKLPRGAAAHPSDDKWAAKLADERRRLEEDHEALRVREENLREYEARLRSLQEDIEAHRLAPAPAAAAPARTASPFVRPSSRTPFESDAALQTAWEKLHRARELLEAEQTHMRHERVIAQDKENELKHREKAVSEREQHIAERERLLIEAVTASAVEESQPIVAEHTMSAVTRLTRAPFDMARSVFGARK
jgi:DNA repair exonuclease SbcCD ATPase subunit